MKKNNVRSDFGEDYYNRYYLDPKTRAIEEEDLRKLVTHVIAYANYLDIPVRRALDAGCGLGMWKKELKKQIKGVKYTGIETSEFLCKKFKWKRASITTFKSRTAYDLVICQSLLQYLPADEVKAGLKNLASLCRGVMYLEIVTKEDWENNCDHVSTDAKIHMRSAAWYRREIARHFINCGGGVFIPNDSDAVLYELEKAQGLRSPTP